MLGPSGPSAQVHTSAHNHQAHLQRVQTVHTRMYTHKHTNTIALGPCAQPNTQTQTQKYSIAIVLGPSGLSAKGYTGYTHKNTVEYRINTIDG